MSDISKAKELLINAKQPLAAYLQKSLQSRNFSYLTFGTEIQPFITEFLVDLFTKKGFKSHKPAKDKNEFPDFTLNTPGGHPKAASRGHFKSGHSDSLFSAVN